MRRIHELFKNYCEDKGFEWRESASMVSVNPKLLFNISGGVIFEDLISSGCFDTVGKYRIASIQKCLRTDGWGEIGISGRHHLSFEMLGHFSLFEFEDYSAKEIMINTAWGFLTKGIGLSPKCLLATIHPLDRTSLEVWSKLGVATIFSKDNITVTPQRTRCGFRTEIVWKPNDDWKVELWNLVFTQFQGTKLFENPLKVIACDSGASLDRIVTAKEGLKSDYDNSNWRELIIALSKHTVIRDREKINRIADLGKAAILLAKEGLRPGNKTASYVLRKIIRDAYTHCQMVSIPFYGYCLDCCNWWEIDRNYHAEILNVLTQEAIKFSAVIDRGMKKYRKMFEMQGYLNSEQYEYLHSTYGISRSLIEMKNTIKKDGDA